MHEEKGREGGREGGGGEGEGREGEGGRGKEGERKRIHVQYNVHMH